MKTHQNKVYQKHLTPLDRQNIEKLLKADFKLYQIAERLQKDTTTISKEIRKHLIEHIPSSFNNPNLCKYKRECKLMNICSSSCRKECSNCIKCNSVCKHYEKDICPKLLTAPYVCTSCKKYAQCIKIKYIYIAS